MMDIKLIYSFILLGTSSALAPGRNPLRTLAVENGNGPETSPAQLPAALVEVVVELAGVSAKEIETAQQNVEGAVSSMEDQMVAMAEELEQLSPEASFILLVEKEIEFVEELLTKLTKEGTETADISAMLKEVDVTMIEAKEADDPSNIAELLASSLESMAAIMEQMPNAEGMDLQEVTMTKTVGYSDFKTFVLQLKNVIKFCLLKHGRSTPSHKSKTSKVTYKSEKENWKEECLGELKGYKLSSALLGLKDYSEVMAGAIGMDISAMDMESVAQDTTEATTISVGKFQAYDSSGMHKYFPAAISTILVASAFIVLL